MWNTFKKKISNSAYILSANLVVFVARSRGATKPTQQRHGHPKINPITVRGPTCSGFVIIRANAVVMLSWLQRGVQVRDYSCFDFAGGGDRHCLWGRVFWSLTAFETFDQPEGVSKWAHHRSTDFRRCRKKLQISCIILKSCFLQLVRRPILEWFPHGLEIFGN